MRLGEDAERAGVGRVTRLELNGPAPRLRRSTNTGSLHSEAIMPTSPSKRITRVVVFILGNVLILFGLVAGVFCAFPRDVRSDFLVELADDGYVFAARMCLLFGADANHCGNGSFALHNAAARGDIEMMKLFLDHGADPNQPGWFDVTPLYLARTSHQAEAEKFLLDRGANPDTSHIHPP
jgi:hypothetical protein